MILTIAKPAMGVFADDIKASVAAIDAIKSEVGATGNSLRINKDLTLDFGLQIIVLASHMDKLSRVEQNLSGVDLPFAMHAPYNYGNPSDWTKSDLSRGREGLDNLLKVIATGDAIGSHSIAVHPNSIREKSEIMSSKYTAQQRQAFLKAVIENVREAQSHARTTSVDLENKPLPATTVDNEGVIYTIVGAPVNDIVAYCSRGGKITFDTCHYGITMETINNARKELGNGLTDDKLHELEMAGYFAADYQQQPSIAEAMIAVGPSINHIHLNDGSVFRPVNETGERDMQKRLPKVGGFQLYWEAYVPGKGELCDNSVMFPWLRKHQADNRRVVATVEVTEFDRNYAESPRFKESALLLVKDIVEKF